MTSIKVHGVNRVRAKGCVYYYHRASGKRILADPTDAAAFAAEVAALNANKPSEGPKALPGTLGGLIAAYRGASAFLELAPDTRRSYQRAFDACKAIDSMPVSSIDQMFILGLQERIYKKRGRWLANMVVSVLSVVLGWGVPRGIAESNAATGVPKIRRPRGAPVPNRAWTAREIDAALEAATGGLREGHRVGLLRGASQEGRRRTAANAREAQE